MSLGDVDPFEDWVEREQPTDVTIRLVEDFIHEAAERPWASPSFPVPELCDPISQVRKAILFPPIIEPPVTIWYQETYNTGVVDVIAVTS